MSFVPRSMWLKPRVFSTVTPPGRAACPTSIVMRLCAQSNRIALQRNRRAALSTILTVGEDPADPFVRQAGGLADLAQAVSVGGRLRDPGVQVGLGLLGGARAGVHAGEHALLLRPLGGGLQQLLGQARDG